MEREHTDNLGLVRDHLVEDRRNMVRAFLSDPQGINELAGEFAGLQQLIDMVERAISHEHSLAPPSAPARDGKADAKPMPPMSFSRPKG